jgi:drug/metabolite transporter (DMT)-like permease
MAAPGVEHHPNPRRGGGRVLWHTARVTSRDPSSTRLGMPGPARRGPLAVAALTATAMVAFASNSLLCRAALGQHLCDAASFTTLRLAGGAVALWLLVRARGVGAPRVAPGWGSATALFAYAISFSLAYLRIPAGTGALLLFAAVQVTMIGAGLRAGERPAAREWVGLALSLGGLIVLTRPGLAQPDPLGAALMLLAGAAWGIYSLRGRGTSDPLAANAASFVRATPLALAVSALGWGLGEPRITATGVALALVSGAIASGLGYAIWYAALAGLSATRAAIVQLSVPPLAVAGGIVLLGESLSSRILLASASILGGIALAVSAKRG